MRPVSCPAPTATLPQRLYRSGATPQQDLYSDCVTLYHWLTGLTPTVRLRRFNIHVLASLSRPVTSGPIYPAG
jgi:hypothetical protein